MPSDDMKKVLLVDDDAVLRIGLKTLIDWEQHGYILSGEADNGIQALELARQLRPDIIITDMKMPGMDGNALIRALHELAPMPYVIVLSGYDDFLLVREAMKQGAADYLLKLELSPSILLSSLANAPAPGQKSRCDEPDNPMQKDQILRDLVSNFYLDAADMQTRMQQAGINFQSDAIYCLLLKAGDLFRFEEATEEEYHTLMFSIRNITSEIVDDCMNAYSVNGRAGEFYILGEIQPQFQNGDTNALVHQLAARLRTMLMQYLDISCVIGIARDRNSVSGMTAACKNAENAIRSRFYSPNSGILWWHGDIESKDMKPLPSSLYPLRQALSTAMATLNEQEIHRILERLRQIFLSERYSRGTVYLAMVSLAGTVQDSFEHCGVDASSLLTHSRRDLTQPDSFQTIGEVCLWLEALEKDLTAYIKRERENGSSMLVERTKSILSARYGSDISLAEVAQELELSPGYISAQMKKHTGMSFSEYLTRLRIDKAKELLETSDQKIYAVADAVGYEDAFYFSRIFKRLTGVSPVDWRKSAFQRKHP